MSGSAPDSLRLPRLASPGEVPGPIVVLAPHCDDEVLGCGGLLIGSRGAFARHVVFLAEPDPERHAEWVRAAGWLVPDSTTWCGLPDRPSATAALDGAVRRLAQVLRRERPISVVVPNRSDPHPLHRAAHAVLAAALAAEPDLACDILECDGMTVLEDPTVWVRIDAVAEAKTSAIRCYASQERRYRLSEIAAAINRYRALTFPQARAERVEAFRVTPATRLRGGQA